MTHAPAVKRQDQNGEEVQRPPHPDIDGGWGWWVVFASFMIHIVSEYPNRLPLAATLTRKFFPYLDSFTLIAYQFGSVKKS